MLFSGAAGTLDMSANGTDRVFAHAFYISAAAHAKGERAMASGK